MDTFDIEITTPFDMKIRILEFEDKTLSIKILINYFFILFQEKVIEINNSVWLQCASLDDFISQIYKITKGEHLSAILKDLSGEVVLQIKREAGEIKFMLYYNQDIMRINIHNSIGAILDEEQLNIVYEKLNSIDKWW